MELIVLVGLGAKTPAGSGSGCVLRGCRSLNSQANMGRATDEDSGDGRLKEEASWQGKKRPEWGHSKPPHVPGRGKVDFRREGGHRTEGTLAQKERTLGGVSGLKAFWEILKEKNLKTSKPQKSLLCFFTHVSPIE